MSNLDSYIDLCIIKEDAVINTYEIINEKEDSQQRETTSGLHSLHQKKFRIKCAMQKLKTSNNIENLTTNNKDLFDFFKSKNKNFSFVSGPASQNTSSTFNEKETALPEGCERLLKRKSKIDCKYCPKSCLYSVEDIFDPINPIAQYDILEELKSHGHPTSRIMANGKLRKTEEARRELLNHYSYAHKENQDK